MKLNKGLKRAGRFCVLGLLLIVLSGCGGSTQFDRKQMVADITNNVIVANHELFAQSSATLLEQAQNYQADPSKQNQAELQQAWLETSNAWMGVSPFEFDVVKDALIHNRIDNRPAREAFIEEKVAGRGEISAEVLATVGSSSQGLSAIEYLVFSDKLAEPRRIEYVVSSAELVNQNADALLKIWSTDGQNYAQQFIDADLAGGNIQGSMNMLFNQVLEQIEMITWDRLGKPLGKRSSGAIRADLVEAPMSQSSLARIKATLDTLHRVYTADGVAEDKGGNGVEGSGIDSYLDFLETDNHGDRLSQKIEAQFVQTKAALNAIPEPLGATIENNPAVVEAAYEELRALITILKVDAAGQMGITLTFNDNDGD